MKNHLLASIILLTIFAYISHGVGAENADTGIKITNIIKVDDNNKQAQLIYNIVTPKIIHYDFVLALDSSGSFEEKSTQLEAVKRDIPRFLSKIPIYYPDAYFNISIISWDDNIDFAYDKRRGYVNINKKIPLPYELTPLENITKDFNKFNGIYKSDQTETTDYSVPIKASLDILNNPENAPRDPLHTRRFIVLVTGNGEYKPCDPNLINETLKEKIGIYTVGLDVGDKSKLSGYLKNISKNEIHPTPSATGWTDYRFVDTTYFETELNKTIEVALKEHFDSIMNKSVADSIELSDWLYDYYEPNIGSLSIDTKKGNSIKRSQTALSEFYYYPENRDDNTSQIVIKIPELLPNSTTTVAFTAENTFNPMKLPVTVSPGDGPIIISSPTSRAPSKLKYTWAINGRQKEVPLDVATRILNEGRLNIMSAESSNLGKTEEKDNLAFINMLASLFLPGSR